MSNTSNSSNNDKPWRDEQILRELYHKESMTQEEIADELGCTNGTVSRWMTKHNISKPWKQKDILKELYHDEGLTQKEVANKLGCTKQTIIKWMNKFNIKARSGKPQTEIEPYSVHENGYTYLCVYDAGTTHNVYVHRLLAIAEYGIDEVIDNDIHHKNGIPWDNRPSNIEPLNRENHLEHHRKQQHPDDENPHRDKDTLYKLYHKKGMTLTEVADELNCSETAVFKWMKRYDIERRRVGRPSDS